MNEETTSALDLIERMNDQPARDVIAKTLNMPSDEVKKHLASIRDTLTDTPEAGSKGLLKVDGASRDNPGLSGGGAVLEMDDETLEKKEFFGRSVTNNEAEYRALLLGLSLLPDSVKSPTIQMDSELVVKQLQGEYQVKSERLRPYYERALKQLEQLNNASLEHIPREENEEADALANEAIDKFQRRQSVG